MGKHFGCWKTVGNTHKHLRTERSFSGLSGIKLIQHWKHNNPWLLRGQERTVSLAPQSFAWVSACSTTPENKAKMRVEQGEGGQGR